MRRAPLSLLLAIVAAACTADANAPGNLPAPSPDLACAGVFDVALEPGKSVLLDAGASAGCVRFPGGRSAREYLAVAYSASGQTSLSGISAPYHLRGRVAGESPAGASAALDLRAADQPSTQEESGPERFHELLRTREGVATPTARAGPLLARLSVAPPILGDHRAFGVCADPACGSFVDVPATAAYIGPRFALFVDDSLPGGGFTPADLQRFGRLFDEHLYGMDTAAFGRESDVDGNGVVIAVMTRQLNRLCPQIGGVVAGYFYGLDLRVGDPGSNGGEIFYLVAPDPNGENGCRITTDLVNRVLPGTLAHEFQHMISFNQHVLVRHGEVENSWLNEGLSHLAEEMAGKTLPASECILGDCVSQFAFSDVSNAYQYLLDPERWFSVYPSSSTGRTAERGAAWLFVRWVLDQQVPGSGLTRALVQTDRLGAANIAAATATPFETLVGRWLLANYLDNLPGFAEADFFLRYSSWDWRVTFASLRAQSPAQYPRAFPLVPDSTGGAYDRDGTLRGGSGRYLRITREENAVPLDLRLTDPTGAGPIDATVEPRIAIVRIR